MLKPEIGDTIIVHGIVDEIFGTNIQVIRARAVDGHKSMFSVYPDEVRAVIPAPKPLKEGDTVKFKGGAILYTFIGTYGIWAIIVRPNERPIVTDKDNLVLVCAD